MYFQKMQFRPFVHRSLHYITTWGMFYQETKVVEGCMIGFTYRCLIVQCKNANLNGSNLSLCYTTYTVFANQKKMGVDL